MVLKIGKKFLILAVSEPGDRIEKSYAGSRISIVLGPGRAFGSGEHETTRSCLEELEGIPLGLRSRVLDLGSGTGILAIAAAKMGAPSVIALDTSPDAIETTLSNVRLNRVENSVAIKQGGLEVVKDELFDLILANLYGDIVLSLVGDLRNCLASSGRLVVSGIHYDDNYEVRAAFIKTEFRLVKERFLENYTTMVFQMPC